MFLCWARQRGKLLSSRVKSILLRKEILPALAQGRETVGRLSTRKLKTTPILAEGQQCNNHARLESVTVSMAFATDKTFEYYLNQNFSFYCDILSRYALESTVAFILKGVEAILVDILKFMFLIRWEFPSYYCVWSSPMVLYVTPHSRPDTHRYSIPSFLR